jgi:hypothetical protein
MQGKSVYVLRGSPSSYFASFFQYNDMVAARNCMYGGTQASNAGANNNNPRHIMPNTVYGMKPLIVQ